MSFDRLAPHYRWMEWILAGDKLQNCRVAFLEEIETPTRVLLVGEGHGRFLEVLRARFPQAVITVLDSSEAMLRVARGRAGNPDKSNPTRFEQGDDLRWEPVEKFDVIATHFFLDCFTASQLAELIPKLARCLEPNGTWLLADFCIPERGWQRFRAKAIHRVMYGFFRATTRLNSTRLTSPDSFLARAGLRLEKRCIREWGLLHSDLWRNPPR